MDYLLIFIFGIVFVNCLFPILDSFSTWIQNVFGSKSVLIQKSLDSLDENEEEFQQNQIGFHFNQPEEKVND